MTQDISPDFALDALDTLTASEAGAAMTVRDLDGRPMKDAQGVELSITLLGPDSSTYRRMMREQVVKRMNATADGTPKPDADTVQANAESDAIELMAACTMRWQGFNDRAGEPIPCTRQAAEALYRRYPVIREQVDGFIFHRKNFLPVSSKA